MRSGYSKNCEYILLAEFDIDEGSLLSHQYPEPTGCDGHLLAELMLPDGAHLRAEDWTVFYLNQTKATTLQSAHQENASTDTSGSASAAPSASHPSDILYVMSLVRTKHGAAYKRGALVKAMAVCSTLPYIQIFKPVLLLALEDYFNEPSPIILKHLYESINAIDLTYAPRLSFDERLVLRQSERKDLFEEKFVFPDEPVHQATGAVNANLSAPSSAGLEEDSSSMITKRSATPQGPTLADQALVAASTPNSGNADRLNIPSSSDMAPRVRVASDNSARSILSNGSTSKNSNDNALASMGMQRKGSAFSVHGSRNRSLRDTHFYDTNVTYNNLTLPIRIPLSTFPTEVGDYSLITLIQTFSNFTGTVGPLHPHLHTNGSLTPPIIVLFNAILTYKRVLFLGGSGSPASQVSNFVLSACALASGCGQLFGTTVVERAFPYSNLTNLDNVCDVKGYIAGVSNPRFEDLTSTWDVLCNIESGRIIISKDIQQAAPSANNASSSSFSASSNASTLSLSTSSTATHTSSTQHTSSDGAGPVASSQSPEPMSAISGIMPFGQYGQGIQNLAGSQGHQDSATPTMDAGNAKSFKMEGRLDSSENTFMDEIISAIQSHFGEAVIRGRFVEYLRRFVRLASRYEEETFGTTSIDFPSLAYAAGRLGSGLVFASFTAEELRRELQANAGRIEGWRRTRAYEAYKEQWMNSLQQQQGQQRDGARAIKGIDLHHQIARLRYGKKISSDEMEAICWSLKEGVRSDEQVIELLSHLPSHLGGLLPVAFGLFHPSPHARDSTVTFLNTLNAHATGAKFLQNLNAFHRLAYSRLALEKAESTSAAAYGGHKRQQSAATLASTNSSATTWETSRDRESPLPPIPTSA